MHYGSSFLPLLQAEPSMLLMPCQDRPAAARFDKICPEEPAALMFTNARMTNAAMTNTAVCTHVQACITCMHVSLIEYVLWRCAAAIPEISMLQIRCLQYSTGSTDKSVVVTVLAKFLAQRCRCHSAGPQQYRKQVVWAKRIALCTSRRSIQRVIDWLLPGDFNRNANQRCDATGFCNNPPCICR